MSRDQIKEYMSISEFAEVVGVSQSTLRNWDRSGKMCPHHRTIGGQRVYAREQADELLGPGDNRVRKIQGRKGRDIYYFHYEDNSVTDKIGNKVFLNQNIDNVQEITLQDALDSLFHNLYLHSNAADTLFLEDKKIGKEITWIRMQ